MQSPIAAPTENAGSVGRVVNDSFRSNSFPQPQPSAEVLTLHAIDLDSVRTLLTRHRLALELVADAAPIPGSYWGEPEAGVIAQRVFGRGDTPVHSLMHEACHLIVAAPERRALIHTDASESEAEEDAACYLQILLADALPGVGRQRMMDDMDAWGYTFRLGCARAWFERDADDARVWLADRGLIPAARAAA